MTTKLPPESFVALAAVAWVDGRMSKDEATGIVATATHATFASLARRTKA